MCGLCGLFGAADAHWSDGPGAAEAASHSRRRLRLQRVALVNRVLSHHRLRLDDWRASAYILRSATGKTELVADLMSLWPAANRLLGDKATIDPLDPALLAALGANRDANRPAAG